MTSPIPFSVFAYSINLYWTLTLCWTMGYMLVINSEQERKCNWGMCQCLWSRDFLHILPTFRSGVWFLLAERWAFDAVLLVLVSLFWRHPPYFQNPCKTPFLLLCISLCSLPSRVLRKLIQPSLLRKKENSRFGFFSLMYQLSSPLSLCLSFHGLSHLWSSQSMEYIPLPLLSCSFAYLFVFSVLWQTSLTSQPQIHRNVA